MNINTLSLQLRTYSTNDAEHLLCVKHCAEHGRYTCRLVGKEESKKAISAPFVFNLMIGVITE